MTTRDLPLKPPHLRIADRMGLLEPSGIRRFFDLAKTMKNPVNLSIGQADYEPPPVVVDAAIEAMRSGKNRYSVTQGEAALLAKLRAKLAEKMPVTDDDELMVTSGVSGGIMLSYLCALNPGDEILIPDPYFVMYKHLANVTGAVPKLYSTFPDFRIRRENLEAAATERTRAILLNSPSNPTGYVASREEIEAVSDFARERGLLLISDEIYDSFVYDGELARPKEFHEGTMVLGGFSKNLGIPGWRMGFALGPKALIEQMRILQQFSFVCAPTPAQWGVLAGLDVDFSGHLADYRRKRDFIFGALKDRFEVVKPGGAFYIFPKLPHGVSDDAFVARCIERNLLVVPGSACCSRKDYLRVSFAASDEDLRRGAEILNAVADSFRP
jgi:aspartate aminotransferase/aminotransferase